MIGWLVRRIKGGGNWGGLPRIFRKRLSGLNGCRDVNHNELHEKDNCYSDSMSKNESLGLITKYIPCPFLQRLNSPSLGTNKTRHKKGNQNILLFLVHQSQSYNFCFFWNFIHKISFISCILHNLNKVFIRSKKSTVINNGILSVEFPFGVRYNILVLNGLCWVIT